MSNQKISCKHARGNGGAPIKCLLSGDRCPYQRWCRIRRMFETKPTVIECKDFSAKQK